MFNWNFWDKGEWREFTKHSIHLMAGWLRSKFVKTEDPKLTDRLLRDAHSFRKSLSTLHPMIFKETPPRFFRKKFRLRGSSDLEFTLLSYARFVAKDANQPAGSGLRFGFNQTDRPFLSTVLTVCYFDSPPL